MIFLKYKQAFLKFIVIISVLNLLFDCYFSLTKENLLAQESIYA